MAANSLTYKYIPRIEQREKNLFVEEYYSSTDVRIYMDDEEQTEIGYINYSLQEQLKPIYGYSSRTFDDIAIGNRIVTGTFKVPIKNPENNSSVAEMNSVIEDNYSADAYNRQQQEEGALVDWIHTNNNPIYNPNTTDYINNNDNDTVTQWMLDQLNNANTSVHLTGNPDIDRNSILNQFKTTFNYEPNNILTDDIEQEAEDDIKSKDNVQYIHLEPGSKLYYGPSIATDYDETESYTQVILISNKISGWSTIQTLDGSYRYIPSSND